MEQSEYYKTFGDSIKSIEFISFRSGKKLFFIEGKSSSPKPISENKQKLNEFIDPIVEKFLHSYQMYLSTKFHINIDAKNEFPDCLFKHEISEIKIIFLLIINGHEQKWLMPILDCLHKKLIVQKKIWKVEIAVWNDEMARKHNFIKP